MDIYFPTFTDSFLKGQSVLYKQFNDIEFYIEDKDQENMYFHILKKLFPKVQFEKIFPLNGKSNVITDCKQNANIKNKIYIVDRDFDEILNKIEVIDNLFYLNCYSIENLLISKTSFYELIKERSPKLKDTDISQLYSHNEVLKNVSCLKELANIFIVIREYELGETFYKINTIRDFNIITDFSYKGNLIQDYKTKIENKLKLKDKRFTLNSKTKKHKHHFRNLDNQLANIPGKYLLCFINDIMKSKNLIFQYSLESLSYKLSKEIDVNNFKKLKTDIKNYLQN